MSMRAAEQYHEDRIRRGEQEARVEWLEQEVDRLRTWIASTQMYSATCDWGNCDQEVVGLRQATEPNRDWQWLVVCQEHYDDAPDDQRIYVGDE